MRRVFIAFLSLFLFTQNSFSFLGLVFHEAFHIQCQDYFENLKTCSPFSCRYISLYDIQDSPEKKEHKDFLAIMQEAAKKKDKKEIDKFLTGKKQKINEWISKYGAEKKVVGLKGGKCHTVEKESEHFGIECLFPEKERIVFANEQIKDAKKRKETGKTNISFSMKIGGKKAEGEKSIEERFCKSRQGELLLPIGAVDTSESIEVSCEGNGEVRASKETKKRVVINTIKKGISYKKQSGEKIEVFVSCEDLKTYDFRLEYDNEKATITDPEYSKDRLKPIKILSYLKSDQKAPRRDKNSLSEPDESASLKESSDFNSQDLIEKIKTWRSDPRYESNTLYQQRWTRVLIALGEEKSSSLKPLPLKEVEFYVRSLKPEWSQNWKLILDEYKKRGLK